MSNQNNFTIVDIAKRAGVSVSTISRILNGKQDVAPKTRLRVQQVIDELGYQPHAQARRLRSGKTRTIALLYPFQHTGDHPINYAVMDFLMGAATVASENGFFFSLITTPVTETSLLSLYQGSQLDGVILMQIYLQDWRVQLLQRRQFPFVMIGHCEDNHGITYIDFDFENFVITAFEHLVMLGHRHIGFITFSETLLISGYGPAVRSMRGYDAALNTYAIDSVCREIDFGVEYTKRAVVELFECMPSMSAVITAHHGAVPGIAYAAESLGRKIPNDLSVISLLDEQTAELLTPRLTTIDFPAYEMGYQGAEMLIEKLEDGYLPPKQVLVPPRLVLRDSTRAVIHVRE
jgi:DNA-binding LacI/PurR family transcriptional regulator